jgi:hypothetical protein
MNMMKTEIWFYRGWPEQVSSFSKNIRMATIINHLTDKCFLLIFDNLEDFHAIRNYLPTTEQASVLVTQRKNTGLPSTFLTLEISTLPSTEGAALLLRILGHSTSEEQQFAKELSDLVSGMPVTIHVIAGFIRERHMTIYKFLQFFTAPKASSVRKSTTRGYGESLWDELEISFRGLKPEEAQLLGILSVFNPDNIPLRLFRLYDTQDTPVDLETIDFMKDATK